MRTVSMRFNGGFSSGKNALRKTGATALIAVLLLLAPGWTARAALAAEETGVTVEPVAAERLPNVPGNQLTAVVVKLAPGAKSPKHHHAGFVFAYVLSGTVRSQLNGGTLTDYRAGQSWVEPPDTEHTLSENPSSTMPASLLAVFVAPDGARLTTFAK
jgi:quercetin dioxygenase-like cupin family protein